MRDPSRSSVDPETDNVIYSSPLEITKGDHSNMPARTDAYLPGDERGHVTASSLGGVNSTANVVAQHHDVNRAFVSMERGERTALQNGSDIYSEKTAVVNGRPGAFLLSDTVTYADGHAESIHHSFANASNAEQEVWNAQSAELPGVAADYAPADHSGAPAADCSADADAASAGDTVAAVLIHHPMPTQQIWMTAQTKTWGGSRPHEISFPLSFVRSLTASQMKICGCAFNDESGSGKLSRASSDHLLSLTRDSRRCSMEIFITGTGALLIVAYVSTAAWLICRSDTIGGTIRTAAAFLCGSILVVPLAGILAAVLCRIIIVVLIVVIVFALFACG